MTNPEVQSFIRSTFRSVWSLELLLFLKRNRERSWSHQEMVTNLRGSDVVVHQGVESLSAAGLIVAESDNSVRYCPSSSQLETRVEEVEAFYSKSPDAVRRMIVSAGSGGLSAFVDAFKIWKD